MYRRDITIDNSDGGTLTKYQVLVKLTDHTHIDSNGDSIRFTDMLNNIKYDYWIESWDTSGTSIIWVEVPLISTGTSYMYLWSTTDTGPSAESNGDATFQFFDDFYNLDSWSYQLATVSGGILTLDPDGTENKNAYVRRTTPTGYDLAIRTRQNWREETDCDWREQSTGWASANNENRVVVYQHWDTCKYFLCTKNDICEIGQSVTLLPGAWHVLEVRRLSDKAEFSLDDGSTVTNRDCYPIGSYPQRIRYDYSGTGQLQADWFLIRKYSGSDPGTSVGVAVDAGGGAPVPELQTVILFSVGLLVLAGYVLLRRREKKKGE